MDPDSEERRVGPARCCIGRLASLGGCHDYRRSWCRLTPEKLVTFGSDDGTSTSTRTRTQAAERPPQLWFREGDLSGGSASIHAAGGAGGAGGAAAAAAAAVTVVHCMLPGSKLPDTLHRHGTPLRSSITSAAAAASGPAQAQGTLR